MFRFLNDGILTSLNISSPGSSPQELFEFIEDHVFPRGLLHPAHTLVLRAKDSLRDHIMNLNRNSGEEGEWAQRSTRGGLAYLVVHPARTTAYYRVFLSTFRIVFRRSNAY